MTIVGTKNLPGELAYTASMLYSNNMTTFVSTLVRDGELFTDLDDEVLVGASKGSEFHVPGMGGVLLCHDGKIHDKQTRLMEVIK